MEVWKWAAIIAWAVQFIGLVILVVFSLDWIYRLIFGGVVIVSGYAAARFGEHAFKCRTLKWQKQKQESDERDFVQIMNHIRHQWMNELQVLYGYIQLQKFEKLKAALEKIKMKAQQESFLSRLGVPSLVAFLFWYQTRQQAMKLEVRITEEIDLKTLPVREERVAGLMQQMILTFEKHADPTGMEANALCLTIAREGEGLLFDFSFSGELADDVSLKKSVKDLLFKHALDVSLHKQEYDKKKASVAVYAPFRAAH